MKLRVIQSHRVSKGRGYEERIAGSVVEIEGEYDPNLYGPVEEKVEGLKGLRVKGSTLQP